MKKTALFFFALIIVTKVIAQTPKTDAALNTQGTTIKNETVPNLNTPLRVGTWMLDENASKVNISNYAGITASGTNTYTGTVSPAIISYAPFYSIKVTFPNANTGPATLALNGLAAKNIKKILSGAIVSLASGDICAGCSYWLMYNGSDFQILGGGSSGGGGGGGVWGTITGTISDQTDLQNGFIHQGLNTLTQTLKANGAFDIRFGDVTPLTLFYAKALYPFGGSASSAITVNGLTALLTHNSVGATENARVELVDAGVTLSGNAIRFLPSVAPIVGQVPIATNIDGTWTWQNIGTLPYIPLGGSATLTADVTVDGAAAAKTINLGDGFTINPLNRFNVNATNGVHFKKGSNEIIGFDGSGSIFLTPTGTATGDMYFHSVAGNFERIPIGANTYIMTSDGTNPSWQPAASGGITNTAANNEIPKSNGTNIIPSGILSPTLGSIILGLPATTGNRSLTTDGSQTDVPLTIVTKGIGEVGINAVQGSTSFLVKAESGHALAFNVTNASSTSLLSINNSTGVATFSSPPVIPTPVGVNDAAPKNYVDGLTITTPVAATLGGTGFASYAVGDILRATTTTALSKLALGSALQGLRVNAGGTDIEWAAISGGGTPGGSTTQLQYNNAGVFGGMSAATYNSGTGVTTFTTAPVVPTGTPLSSDTKSANQKYVDDAILAAGLTIPITIPNGGTGNTSFVAYSLLAGGTTSTGALQQISNAGAVAGYNLTWVSSSALPTWQAAAVSGWSLSGASTITGNTSQSGAFTNTFLMDGVLITQNALSAGWKPALKITPGAGTGMTTGTEFNTGIYVPAFTNTWTGTTGLSLQRFNYFAAPTASNASAMNITDLYNAYFDAPLIAGSMTATNKWALGSNGNFKVIGNSTITGTLSTNGGGSVLDATGLYTNNIRPGNGATTFTMSGAQAANPAWTFGAGASFTQTTGTIVYMGIIMPVAAASGSANFAMIGISGGQSTAGTGYYAGMLVNPTYNLVNDTYGLRYDPTIVTQSGTNYAWYSTSGSALFGNSNANTLTASTRIDVRGIGTTTGNTLRLADSGNTTRLTVLDNGNTTLAGNFTLSTAGNGLYIKEGTNATMGIATLVGGTVTVSTTKVTANSRIIVEVQSLGTVTIPSSVGITARTAGTSFVITSSAPTDTSSIAWFIIEPAP